MNLLNVLIVEDIASHYRTTKTQAERTFKKMGIDNVVFLEQVKSYQEFRTKGYEKERIDIAIIDMELEENDNNQGGVEFIHSLRDNYFFPQPIRIIWTGRALDPQDIKEVVNIKGAQLAGYYIKTQEIKEFKLSLEYAWKLIDRKRKINLLDNFVDDNLKEQILKGNGWDQLINGAKCKKAFFFCDLSNSSRFIKKWDEDSEEKHSALVIIKSFFCWATEIVNKHNGVVDKYIGDEIMAYFGGFSDDPQEISQAAFETALEIRDSFDLWLSSQKKLYEDNIDGWPHVTLNVKIAINFGEVFWGVVGPKNVTIMTHQVINLARIMQHRVTGNEEGITKKVDDKLIDSGEIWITNSLFKNLKPSQQNGFTKVKNVNLRDFEGFDKILHYM